MNTTVPCKRVSGGMWDKLGQRYESLWTVDALLSVLRGEAVSVTIEPHAEDGEGVELLREFADGGRRYLSAKRQTISNVWSLAELTRPKESGRSVLGDLLNRLGDDPGKNFADFVSGTTANKLLRLCEAARRANSSKAFEQEISLNADLQGEFDKYILKRLSLNISSAWRVLAHLYVDGCTEDLLRRCLERDINRDVASTACGPLSSAGARLVLYELVYERFGTAITRDDIVAHLDHHRLAPRDWTRPTPDHENIDRRNRLYSEAVEAELINGVPLPRKEVEIITTALGSSARSVLVTAAAGMGKSCVLAQCLRALTELEIPHLAIRLDSQCDAASASDYGRSLGFSLSPAAVLSGVARGRKGVLVIDQLDALSTASGRNPRLWDLFRELLFEVEHYKHLYVLLACRTYDFEHDSRLRKLADGGTAVRVNLELFNIDAVRNVLSDAGAPVDQYQQRHLELLRTPLHLSVCLQADPPNAEPASDITILYDAYLDFKRERASQRSPSVRFEDTVQRLAQALSERQSLSAPRDVFDAGGLAVHAEALASEHVLVFEGQGCRFFHETFFDYTFARGFVTAVGCLLARLRDDRAEAVTLFLELIQDADAILRTPYIDRFFHCAAFSHYSSFRSLLHRMVKSVEEKIRESAARRISVASFRHTEAAEDLNSLVLEGDEECRSAAAHVFARNLGDAGIADTCRRSLRRLFHDPSKKVREQAANCWRDLSADELVAERTLMREFIESPAFIEGVSGLQHALEQCPERLPEEVLLIPERLVALHKQKAAIEHSSDFYFRSASQLAMRLYQQSRSYSWKPNATDFEARCLNLMDAMLLADRGGMDRELRKLEQ